MVTDGAGWESKLKYFAGIRHFGLIETRKQKEIRFDLSCRWVISFETWNIIYPPRVGSSQSPISTRVAVRREVSQITFVPTSLIMKLPSSSPSLSLADSFYFVSISFVYLSIVNARQTAATARHPVMPSQRIIFQYQLWLFSRAVPRPTDYPERNLFERNKFWDFSILFFHRSCGLRGNSGAVDLNEAGEAWLVAFGIPEADPVAPDQLRSLFFNFADLSSRRRNSFKFIRFH